MEIGCLEDDFMFIRCPAFGSSVLMDGGKPQGFTPPGATKRAGGVQGKVGGKTHPKVLLFFAIFIIFVCENMSEKFKSWCLSVLHLFTIHPGLNGDGSVQVKGPQIDGGNHFEETRFYPKNPMLINCIAKIMLCSHKSHAMFGHVYPIVLSFELQNPCLPSQIQVSRLVEGAKIAASSNDAIIKVDGFLNRKTSAEAGVDIENTSKENIHRSHSSYPFMIHLELTVCFGGLHQLSTLTGLPQLNLYKFRRISYKVSKTLTLPENNRKHSAWNTGN